MRNDRELSLLGRRAKRSLKYLMGKAQWTIRAYLYEMGLAPSQSFNTGCNKILFYIHC